MSTKISVPPPEEAEERQPRQPEEQRPKNRRRTIGIAAGCVAILAALAAIAPFTPVMGVKEITVEGNRTLSADQVRDLAGIAPDTPMGRVDVNDAAHRVASDPWIKTVTVARNWPNTVDVALEEHVAVAYLKQSDGAHLIDRDGKAFLVAEPPAGAVELVGAQADNEQVMADAVDIASSISDEARAEIAVIEVGPFNHVLKTHDGRTIYWGASEDNQNKAYALEAVLQMEGREFNITNPQLVTSK